MGHVYITSQITKIGALTFSLKSLPDTTRMQDITVKYPNFLGGACAQTPLVGACGAGLRACAHFNIFLQG